MKLQYLVLNRFTFVTSKDDELELNELGQKGWELVSVTHNRLYFKKRIED